MNAREIQDWLIAHIAELVATAPDTIDVHEPFSTYGLSSLDAVTLSGDLEELLGRRFPPTLAYDYPSISTLSRYLIGEMENKPSAARENSSGDPSAEPIAIIGMACRFPGANDPEAFWQVLRDGVDTIREVPEDRWPKQAFYDPDPSVPGKAISYWGGFLDNIDQFDPFFFGISPIEAKYMDPQQRLLLELSCEALEDAGQVSAHLDGTKTGVFIGISINEYSHLQFSDPALITSHSGTGSALSIAANRISYFFNFRGPSMAVDTACSSSLAAVHLACQSLRNGECGMALAGGVNVILSPAHSIAFTKAGVLAPDGRCKTFDARANGYVRGEGGGVLVLKPLSSALADGDPVHALILGSAMSQDGRTNGLIAPSREAQEAMLREAYRAAGISPGSVQYVEAHGTGTLLGDSMEAQALGAVLGANRVHGPCAIGSVKTNIGHLEAAAGIAGLIKVVLSLKHRAIPPSLHYQSPNPHIPFAALNLQVQQELNAWPPGAGPAQAGVSSFGFGGTNVHVVIREPDNIKHAGDEQLPAAAPACHLLPLSANSEETLRSLAGDFQEMLAADYSVAIKDLCYAAGVRRGQYDYRLAVIGNSRKELYTGLQAFLSGEPDPNLFPASRVPDRQPGLAFVFSGQGGQWYGMGRELLKQEPVFFETMQRIDRIIQAHFGWSLMDVLAAEPSESRLDEIDVVQPALFAIQVALAELWQSWGIVPDAVVGHSMGEVAAARVAGILSLEDAIQVICQRSRLLRPLRGQGSMLATELSPDQAKELLKGYEPDIAIAVINSPASTVLSGAPETIKAVMDALVQENRFCKLVNVDVASHSPQIDRVRAELLGALAGLQPQPPRIPIYSTVAGARADDLPFDAGYWMDNLRAPVLFSDALGQLLEDGYSTFIEIGPHPVLLGAIRQSTPSRRGEISLLPSMRREEGEREVLLKSLGALYIQGFSIAWNQLYPTGGKYVQLPSIPWQRQRYWIDTPAATSTNPWRRARAVGKHSHSLLGERISLANTPSAYVWQTALDHEVLHFLEDHRVEADIVFPAAAYIEMALQAAEETGLHHSHALSDFVFKERMILQNGKPRSIQALLSPEKESRFLFSIYSQPAPEEDWVLHAFVTFIPHQAANSVEATLDISPDVIRQQGAVRFTAEEFYQTLQARGLHYGPGFRGIQQVWSKDHEALGRIHLPEAIQQDAGGYQIHPALLDACLQVLAATKNTSSPQEIYVPAGCRHIRFFSRPSDGLLWSQVSLRSEPASSPDIMDADLRISDEHGRTVAELIGFRLQRTSRRIRHLHSRQDTWLYRLGWQAQREPVVSSVTPGQRKQWLIFADDEGIGEALAMQLEAGGDHCRLLACKETIQNLKNTKDGALQERIERQLEEISAPLYGIVHLWSLSIPPRSLEGDEATGIMPMLGCNSVLFLVQALARRLGGTPRLWLATRGAQLVQSGEPIAVEQSPLWGLGKVVGFELPELQCIRIDLDPRQSAAETVALLVKQLSTDDREDQIAFRAGVRYVHRLLPFKPATTSSCLPAASLRADSTYLITGGLGGLGLSTAKWMAQRGARHLVLLGRSAPSAWAMRMLDQMQDEGLEILLEQADVSDPAQMEQVFKKIERNMPMLRGVIHAAGVLDDGALLNLDSERMNKVMAPKVEGSWNLHAATANYPLDFFVLFSSAVSVLGAPGQGNYAAASAYLDAMACYRHHLGLPAISINWGPWAEVGLAAEATERLKEQNASTQHLIKVIKIDQGLEILEELLAEPTPQVVVLPFDLKNLLELYPAAAGMPFFSAVGGSDTHVARLYARPNLRQQYIAPRNELERKLAELWRQTLHIDRIGVHDSFFELGGDFVLAAQILGLAQKTFGIRINPQDAFKAFTIERLAEILGGETTTIPRRPPDSPVPLSFPQQRQLFLELLEQGSAVNNLPVFLEITGRLNLDALEKSANQIFARHDALRTRFSFGQGIPAAEVLTGLQAPFSTVDLQEIDGQEQVNKARRLAEKEVLRPFDLTQAPLIRLHLYVLNPGKYLMLVVVHHTIADGWSLGVFLRELWSFYSSITTNQPYTPPALPIQYADFAHWQTNNMRGALLQASMAYWKKQLAGELPALELPTDQPRGAKQTFTGGTYRFTLSAELVQALEKLSRQEDATLFMTLLTAFYLLLYRYSGQDDILVGTPVANRHVPELEPLIGVFINTLVLRTNLAGDPGFRELLKRVRDVCLEAYSHQDLPFEQLVEALKPRRDRSRTPLFQVVFNLQNAPMPKLEIPDMEMRFLEINRGVSQFDLTLMMTRSEGQYHGAVEYNDELFNPATVARMFQSFQMLLEEAIAQPDCPISRLPLVAKEELHRLVYEMNRTQFDYPPEKCVHRLFEAQVERTPHAVAVMHDHMAITYLELNQRANALAGRLMALGVGPGIRVGIFMERSLEIVEALLAVHKAGGTYVPMHTAFPKERVQFILNDAQVQVLLTNMDIELPEERQVQIVRLNDGEPSTKQDGANRQIDVAADDLAYIIYTSGSTGRPKGVMVQHSALLNFLWSMRVRPGIQEGDVLLSVTSISFDIAALELFLPLIAGASVVVATEEMITQPYLIGQAISDYRANIMQATPATWQLLLETGWAGAPRLKALCGGEALTRTLADHLLDRSGSLWNMYGPTETTVWSSTGQIQKGDTPITIGQPIGNTQLYILDQHLQPLSIGVVGELHIGGDGLALGYLNHPQLTREKFIPDCFNPQPGARLYKTGDHARYLPDYSIELLGRMDDQVKVNGHRIELGEIAAALMQHPSVHNAVAITRTEASGDKRLVAYFVANQDTPPGAGALRDFLRQKLPAYMMPAVFIEMNSLPLMPSGKIDRKSLPVPDDIRQLPGYVAPRNKVEQILASIWQDVLDIEQVGIHDNFFDLGGASIQSIQIVAKANISGLRLTVEHIFEHQTIAGLGAYLDGEAPFR